MNNFILITNGNLASMVALAPWLRECRSQILGVYVTYKLPSSKGNLRGILALMAGSGLAYAWLKIWLNRIAPWLLRRQGSPASVEDFLQQLGVQAPVRHVESLKAAPVMDEIRKLGPDLIVSFSATQRFSKKLIALPKLGAINVHYGALPRYAGLSPYFWHLFERDDRFGVTLHRIEPVLDAGQVIEQRICPIGETRSCLGLQLKMAAEVSPMLVRFFKGETGFHDMCPQDLGERTYYGHPTRHQVKEFMENGYSMMSGADRRALFQRVAEINESTS